MWCQYKHEGPPGSLSQQQSCHGLIRQCSSNSEHVNLWAEHPFPGFYINNSSKSFRQLKLESLSAIVELEITGSHCWNNNENSNSHSIYTCPEASGPGILPGASISITVPSVREGNVPYSFLSWVTTYFTLTYFLTLLYLILCIKIFLQCLEWYLLFWWHIDKHIFPSFSFHLTILAIFKINVHM